MRGALFAVEVFPALLPAGERRFGRGQFLVERAFGGLRLRELGTELFDLGAQVGDLRAGRAEMCESSSASVARACASSLRCCSRNSRVWVDDLFGAADFRADLVVTRLHGADAFGLLGLVDALRFDGRFRRALIGERLLHA